MKKELLRNRAGQTYYSFVYYDTASKKRVRLTKGYIQARFGHDIVEATEANEVLRTLAKEVASRENDKQERLAWACEHESLRELMGLYETAQRKSAPNSYQNNMHYLKYYVFYFFLQVAECTDLQEWPLHYESFKEWLEEKAIVTRTPGQLISYNSKNHCIRALNTFMRFLHRKMVVPSFISCPRFPDYQTKEKTIDDVIPEKEMEAIYHQLHVMGQRKEAIFWRLLYFSGMRFNEARGISIENIYEGILEDVAFAKRLAEHKIGYFGYLVLECQPANKTTLRNREGHIPRKPLKGKKKIDEKSARTIPIIDAVLWRELAWLYNEELVRMQQKIWGSTPGNYALFDGIRRSVIKKAYTQLRIPFHNPHCCRHTRATWLVGETGDAILTRMWLGHTSQKVLDKYVHIYQACVRKAKKGDKKTAWQPIQIAI